tara:strand:+ start:6207 stop:7235 length:1029 start_codon:yes stop_codon:yes gene_type:complete
MASKSVFQKYDTDALDYFDLASDPIYGVIAGSNVEDVLVTQDETTYSNIREIIAKPTETDQTFINKKKAFVLPSSPVSNDKIKAALKEHKITVTNDYTQADLIITHDEFDDKFENSETIKTTKMMYKLWNYETTSGDPTSNLSLNQMIQNCGRHVIITPKITNNMRYYALDVEDSLYDTWAITGLALNLAYEIYVGNKSTVSIETVLHTSATRQPLNEDVVDQVIRMWNAGGDDREVATQLLTTLDYTTNHHLMWKLTQELGSLHYNHHNKDLNHWMTASRWEFYYNQNAESMIQWMEEEGHLNKISFKYLEPIVRKDITIHNRELYVFKVSVKKEYQKYLI